MLEFYIKRLLVKLVCCFVPGKKNRQKVKSKFGFGSKMVELDSVNSFVPSDVLKFIESNKSDDYKKQYKKMLNPTPLEKITLDSKRFAPPSRFKDITEFSAKCS